VDVWDIYLTNEVAAWLEQLQSSDPKTAVLVDDAIYALSCSGTSIRPSPGRYDHRLEDQEPEGAAPRIERQERGPHLVRVRSLALGDPAGGWRQGRAVEPVVRRGHPRAEHLYEIYLKERAGEEAAE
jgi:hypothetical protein